MPWQHLHPLIVHFPIALLMIAPAVVLLGLLWPSQRQGIHTTALALLVLGTLAAGAALVTGEAAAALAQRTPELRASLARHEALAQGAALAFGILTGLFGLIHLGPVRGRWTVPACLSWLALSVAAVALLAMAAHAGGRMVHQLGIHSAPHQELS